MTKPVAKAIYKFRLKLKSKLDAMNTGKMDKMGIPVYRVRGGDLERVMELTCRIARLESRGG